MSDASEQMLAELRAMIAALEKDKALLDWADAEGHFDVRYNSLREELQDKAKRCDP